MRGVLIAGVSATLMWGTTNLSAQTVDGVIRPLGRASMASTSSEPMALLRIQVVDSHAPRTAAYDAATIMAVEEAKKRGAIEKADLLQGSLPGNFLVAHTPQAATRLDRLYSENLLRGIVGSPDRNSAFTRLLTTASAARGNLEGTLQSGKLAFSPLGFTRTLSRLPMVRRAIQFNLFSAGDDYAQRLLRVGVEGGQLDPKVLDSTKPTGVFVPESPLGPTPPVSVVEVLVPCKEKSAVTEQLPPSAVKVDFDSCDDARYLRISVEDSEPGTQGVGATPLAAAASAPISTLALELSAASPNTSAETLAAGGTMPPGQLNTADLDQLREALSQEYPQDSRVPLLVVFDDAFPTQQAYRETLALFNEADELLFKSNPSLDRAWLSNLPQVTGTTFDVSSDFAEQPPAMTGPPLGLSRCPTLEAPTCRPHSRKIHDALLPLQEQVKKNTAQPVRVVYVPFFFAQPGAVRVAHSLMRAKFLVADDYNRTLGNEQYTNAARDLYINKFLTPLLERMGPRYPKSPADWCIPATLFDDVVHYFRIYSKLSRTPVFMNFSWRFPTTYDGDIPSRGNSMMLLFAAAGNPCKDGVVCSGPTLQNPDLSSYHFLRKAEHDKAYYLVANVDRTGAAICGSARLGVDRNTLAFAGGIADDCGTSFAAPRAAWIMAAGERYRSFDVKLTQQTELWMDRFKPITEHNPKVCVSPDNMNCLRLNLAKVFPAAKVVD
jgi:hypothetical protein